MHLCRPKWKSLLQWQPNALIWGTGRCLCFPSPLSEPLQNASDTLPYLQNFSRTHQITPVLLPTKAVFFPKITAVVPNSPPRDEPIDVRKLVNGYQLRHVAYERGAQAGRSGTRVTPLGRLVRDHRPQSA